MLNHIALLNFRDELGESDKRIAAVKLKSGLEDLADKIEGLIDIKVETLLLDCSSADILLLCKLQDREALERLKTSPLLFNIKTVIDENLDRVHTADYIS